MQGWIVGQRYRLLSQLGGGGMGSVWLAEHIELRVKLAIKLLDPALAATPEGVMRFRHEAQAAAALGSAHVVRAFDFGIDDDRPYIAMELLQGESLACQLRRVGRLDFGTTCRIVEQVAEGMGAAHRMGIVHRDLKPENILLVEAATPGEFVAKVIDFGIAKANPTAHEPGSLARTRTGALMGTPYYMSPEQASGSPQVDQRTDIWSLAIVAFECVTGSRPFFASSLGGIILQICDESPPRPSALCQVPDRFDAWFARCTEKRPENRFDSMSDAARVLAEIAAKAQVVTVEQGVTTRLESDQSPHARHTPFEPSCSPKALAKLSRPRRRSALVPSRSALMIVVATASAIVTGAGHRPSLASDAGTIASATTPWQSPDRIEHSSGEPVPASGTAEPPSSARVYLVDVTNANTDAASRPKRQLIVGTPAVVAPPVSRRTRPQVRRTNATDTAQAKQRASDAPLPPNFNPFSTRQ